MKDHACSKGIYVGGVPLRRLLFLLILVLFATSACAEVYINQEPPEDWSSRELLRLTVFPAFRNDAFIMECGGESMLIDGGYAQFVKKMQEALAKRGYGEHIDYILNTHPHDDHIEGATDLIRRGLHINTFLSPFAEDYGNKYHRQMVSFLKERNFAYRQVMDGETLQFGGATIDCYSWLEAIDVNARSLQMHVKFGNATLLLTGDLTGLGEHHYLERLPAEDLKSDILKAPHHSLVHMVPEYLDTVDPAFVILTNQKGSAPKSENQLNKRGIPHMYNGSGTITLETDGEDWYVSQVKGWN